MSTRIVMPQLGESVAEGVIGKWLKSEGEQVDRDEPIVEVITDKVNAEIPSPVAGVLEKITEPEGTTVAVGQEIGIIGDGGRARQEPETAAAAGGNGRTVTGSSGSPASVAPDAGALRGTAVQDRPDVSVGGRTETQPQAPAGSSSSRAERVRSSPLVRRLAAEHGIDLAEVPGTGIGGRVSKQDILSFVETKQREQEAVPVPAAPQLPTPPTLPVPAAQPAAPDQLAAARTLGLGEELVPLTAIRRMIADHMVQSVSTIPHATTLVEVDMTNVARFRDARKDEFQAREGVPLSYVAFVVKATVEALKEHPMVNAEWSGEGVIVKKNININVAVDAPEGLTTPVIRQADEKSLAGLCKAVYDLAQRGRARRLRVEDMQGGTFTVNNTGALGSIAGVSIINYPQAAILSAASIVKRPVVLEQDGQDLIAVRHMMNLILTFDHRVLDGGYASAFLNAVKQKLEAWRMDSTIY